jgi:photosystem II stability/assembly factor-like uncharacterized protein
MLRRISGWLAFVVATICVALGTITGASADTAQKIDPRFFGGLKWRLIGPARGGRVLAVTGARGQPEVYYFGSVNGGVWRTNDAGRTWNPIFDSQDIGSIGAIAVAPSNPEVIYVGTGEADMRSDISYGNGMYRSSDGGKTWAQVGLEDTRQIARVIIDPRDPDKLFVAALGHAYGPNAERGVFYSKDGGKHWKRALFRDENTGAIDVAFEPGNPKTMFAALLQTRRPPWNVYPPSKGPGTGLYRSKDGGEHWEQLTGHGLPSDGLGRMGIAFAPSNPRRVYLIADAKEGGLYRSDDGGENWRLASGDKRIWGRGWYFEEVSVDPKNADTIYVPNTGLYRSRDGGKTFEVIKSAPGGDDYHQLWIDPDEPQRMILGCDQGAVVTRNGGATWSSWYNQPIGQFYHVATDNRFPYWVYGAQQDSGAAATLSRGKYSALNFHDWRPMEAGDENGYIAPDPLNPEVLFGGSVERQNLRTEQVEHLPPGLAQTEKLRRTWTLPLVFSPIDAHVLYFGSQILFRTDNSGNSWKTISPDLTREDPGVPANLDPTTAADADAPQEKRRGVIYTIAPSYIQGGEIWAGTDDGLIHITRDEGKTWTNVTPPELTPWSKVTHIEASHFDAATAYAAVDRHRLDDLQPYLYRTRDFGKTWQRVTSGIPEGKFLNCVREDPLRKSLLYACTEKGVYLSFDDGDSWQSLQLNMPTTSIRDLVVHGDDLVVAAHGRAFWILDDAAPLREMSEKVTSADLWLFRPANAYRVRRGSDQGTPVPKDEWRAENPPSGAIIDYWLKEKGRSPVELEILDAEGKHVRRFASDEAPAKIDVNELRVTADWIPQEAALSAEAGVYRFVWDLHYALPKSVRRSFYGPAGPWAVPGNYIVKLTANGKSSSQPLVLKMDPRVTVTQDALQQEFRAASRVSTKLGEISDTGSRMQRLQEQLDARAKDAANHAEASAALRGLQEKLREIVGAPAGEEFGFFGLSLPTAERPTLHKVTSALTGLLMIVDAPDAAPTADARTAVDRWEAAANDVLARWKALEPEVATLNSLLDHAGLKKIE